MPPKTSPAVTRSKTPARQATTAKAAPAPPQEPQPEQVYAGLFGGVTGQYGADREPSMVFRAVKVGSK